MELKIEKSSRHDFFFNIVLSPFSTKDQLLDWPKKQRLCFENTNEHLFQKSVSIIRVTSKSM